MLIYVGSDAKIYSRKYYKDIVDVSDPHEAFDEMSDYLKDKESTPARLLIPSSADDIAFGAEEAASRHIKQTSFEQLFSDPNIKEFGFIWSPYPKEGLIPEREEDQNHKDKVESKISPPEVYGFAQKLKDRFLTKKSAEKRVQNDPAKRPVMTLNEFLDMPDYGECYTAVRKRQERKRRGLFGHVVVDGSQ